MDGSLQVRETHKYVGEYQYLDSWREIGSFKIIASSEPEVDEDDACEGTTVIRFVEVETTCTDLHTIQNALSACFTNWGCAHEYDCCGCWSHSGSAEHLKDKLWKVTINSSRNF